MTYNVFCGTLNPALSNPVSYCTCLAHIVDWFSAVDWSSLVSTACNILSGNGIIAVPTDTIYGVAGLAQSSAAIGRLYGVKGRSCTKPVAISVASVDEIHWWVFVASVCGMVL